MPGSLAVSAQTETSVTLSWAASSDDVGVTGYGHYRAGTLVSSGGDTSHTFSGLECGTTYTFAVDAVDAAGNRSAPASLNSATSACATPTPSSLVAAYSLSMPGPAQR